MELWIRSQDKETLIKIDRLDVDGNKIQANFKSHFSGCDYVILGTYESNDRALEVLDEIQSYLIPKLHHVCDKDLEGNDVKVLGIDSIQTMVYEMPKE